MKKYLLLLICLNTSVLFAQSIAIPQWAIGAGGTGNSPSYVNEVTSIVSDHAGKVIAAGSFAGTIDLDPGSAVANVVSVNTTHLNAFVAKYDSLHNYNWGFSLYSSNQSLVNDIGTDANNNIYVAGEFINQMDADPSTTTTYTLNAAGAGRDMYVAKYTAAGNFVWAFGIGSSLSTDYLRKMISDNDGNIYITGTISDSVDVDPSSAVHRLYATASGAMFIAKYDAAGNFVWAFSIDEASGIEEGQSLAFDGYGNIILGMIYHNTIDADPSANTASFTALGNGDALITRYNMAAGAYVSAFSIGGGTSGPSISSVILSSNAQHQLTVCGRFWGNLDFDPGTATHYLNSASNDDIFLAAYSLTGTYNWCFNIGNNSGTAQPYDLAMDNAGKIYLMGEAAGSADIDPGTASMPLTTFIAVYDSLGSYKYANSFYASSGLYFKGFYLTSPDVFYLGGGFKGSLYYSSIDILFGASNYNAFLVRYAQCLTPFIQSQTPSASLCAEDNFLMSINAIGTGMHYQWYKNGAVFNDTLPTLQLSHVDTTHSGTYNCIISGLCGADTSQHIIITVHLLPKPVIVQVGSIFQTGVYSAYQWYKNGSLIAGANGQTYTPLANNLYFVVVTDSNGCKDTSNMLSLFVNIHETNAADKFSIFPNPVRDCIHISSDIDLSNAKALIYNMQGIMVKELRLPSSEEAIDLSELGNGIYTMRIFYNDSSRSMRIIKLKE
jgi:hypothetical protein